LKNIFTVSWFTIKETMRKKSFIISNVLIIAIIFIIFSILESQLGKYASVIGNNNTSSNKTLTNETLSSENLSQEKVSESNSVYLIPVIAFADNENLFGNYLEDVTSDYFEVKLHSGLSMDELNQLINDGEVYSAVYIYSENGIPRFKYLVSEYGSINSKYADIIYETLQNVYIKKLLEDAGVDSGVIDKALFKIEYNIEIAEKENVSDSSVTVGMVISFVLFFSIYMFGHNISASIASEKNSRVMETLVTSTSPSCIVIGKTLGMGILGLLQLMIICLTTFVCYKTFIPSNLDIASIYFADISINVRTIIFLFVYFILGYTLYAFLNAITGATVSKPEDIQLANLPVSFLTMISFYLSFFSITLGAENKISLFTSMFPLSSPFFMPSRIIANLATTGEIWASIGILVFITAVFSFISIRIYSVAILHYGNRLKFKDLFNIFLRIK